MTKSILIISDIDDNLPNIIKLVFQSSYTINTINVTEHLDHDQIFQSDSQIPDCIIANGSRTLMFNSSFTQSLSVLNKSIPVVIILSTTDMEHLIDLIELKFSNFIISPINIHTLKQKIKKIISLNTNSIYTRSSFISHPYYREFRHEILNSITIAAGYLDLLYSNLTETNRTSYQDKVSEGLQKIQQLLSKGEQ